MRCFVACLSLLSVQPGHRMPAADPDLSMLGERPDWAQLGVHQGTLDRLTFITSMEELYAPHADWEQWFEVSDGGVSIVMEAARPHFRYFLEFSKAGKRENTAEFFGPADAGLPLAGRHIALDPGHIGGAWAEMEHRSFQIGDDPLVKEGDLVLIVAEQLQARLEALGAEVSLIRTQNEPVSMGSLEALRQRAKAYMPRRHPGVSEGEPGYEEKLTVLTELLFYRVQEIRARAMLVNTCIQPDFVLALHFNAEAWPPGPEFQLVEENHGHVLVNGAYMEGELRLDDVRFALVQRILAGHDVVERHLAEAMTRSMVEATGLPPFIYTGKNAIQVGNSQYIWGRNLLANRLYACPVVYLEPYVANGVETYPRIQDYLKSGGDGETDIISEYVRFVENGLVAAIHPVRD